MMKAALDSTVDFCQLDICGKITDCDRPKRDLDAAFELRVFSEPRLSAEQVRILSAELASLRNDRVVRRKQSGYKNAVYLNPDPDDPYKLLVDFTKFNYQRRQKSSSSSCSIVPSARTIRSILRDQKFISTVKVDRAYYKVKLDPKLRPFTGFTFEGVDYVFDTLSPGLRGCDHLLQEAMQSLFADMPVLMAGQSGSRVYPYLETIFIFGETEEEHGRYVAESIDRLTRLRMVGSVPDGLFYQPSVQVLGFHISNNEVRIADEKLRAIKKMKCPKSLKQLLDSIVEARFYREMIRGFARLAAPLTDLLEEPQPLTGKLALKIEHENCFATLKQKLLAAPALAIFDHRNADTYLHVSASKIAIRADLYQIDAATKEKRAVGYFSQKVRSSKKSWDLFELEILATAESFRYFEEYLEKCATFFLCPRHPPRIYLKRYKVSDRLNKLKIQIANRGFNFTRQWPQEVFNAAVEEMAVR